ncbi:hypothetical protein DOY81_009784, partial [Sarcophaga bullata]
MYMLAHFSLTHIYQLLITYQQRRVNRSKPRNKLIRFACNTLKRSSTNITNMAGDDDTGEKQLQKKNNSSVSAITSHNKQHSRKKRTTHREDGKRGNESNIKTNHYKENTSDNQEVIKKCINKSMKLMNEDQMNYDLNHSSEQLTKEETMNCQSIQQNKYNSITDTDIQYISQKERYIYSHCSQPVSFTQSTRRCTPKSPHSGRSVEQCKSENLLLPPVFTIPPLVCLPKNEDVIAHHESKHRLLNNNADFKNDKSLIESVKSWIHTQCQIDSQSDLNGYLESASQSNNINHIDQNKDEDCKNGNPNHKGQMFKLDVIIGDILMERELFIEMCAKNRFYRNPNYNKPWKIFY